MIKILDKEYPEVVERKGYELILKFFEGFLLEDSSGPGYKVTRYFVENDEYQSETVIDDIMVFEESKEKFLQEIEKEIRKTIPEEEIFMEPDFLKAFEKFSGF